MKNQLKAVKVFGTLVIGTLALGGCAKDRDYKSLLKVDDQSKSLINTHFDKTTGEGVYLYVTSMTDGPHSTEGVFPGEMGDERLVRFRFTEKELIAETVEIDPRFKDRAVNQKPLMTIPITHHAYRCAENGAGECANKEEENNDIVWSQKPYFRPDLSGVDVKEVSTLDVDMTKFFSMGKCLTEAGARVVDFKIDSDSVYLEVERTYQRTPLCSDIRELWDIQNLSFNMRQVYSFVKRDQVVSKDYEKVEYPEADKDLFGFFATDQLRLSTDLRDLRSSLTSVLERWNPKRKVIKYGLTKNFAKPENALLLQATRESVQAVNNAFAAADVDLQIELEEPSDQSFGDLRNSMIVLVEDPMVHGVLGYGPAVADPLTGEIISARTVMYAGNLISGIQTTWDDYVAKNPSGKEEKNQAPKVAPAANALVAANLPGQSLSAKNAGLMKAAVEALSRSQSHVLSHSHVGEKNGLPAFAQNFDLSHTVRGKPGLLNGQIRNGQQLAKLEKRLTRQKRDFSYEKKVAEALAEDEKDLLRYRYGLDLFSKKCLYPSDYMNFGGAVEHVGLEELESVPRVSWLELTDDEQKQVIQHLMPYVWIPTLVHELGHNMGLRHNFKGSEDKENFYSQDEITKHGHGTPMVFSSIMDYGYSNFNELRVMGKYDVAALRFAYNREIEKKDGTLVKIAKTAESLPETDRANAKEYQYCTDEHVGPNPGCRRFDEGTNLKDIAQHLLTSYNRYYTYRNFRNGRRNFSDMTLSSHAMRTIMRFYDLRPYLDTYERIVVEFGIDPDAQEWKTIPFLVDLKAGFDEAKKMFLSPLGTPTLSCFVLLPGEPDPQTGQPGEPRLIDVPMEGFSRGTYFPSCFYPDLVANLAQNGIQMLGQFGKSFRDQRFVDNPDPSSDQIDVRGIWPDKLAALMVALERETGSKSFDSVMSNLFEIDGEARNQILGLVNGYLLNRVNTRVDVDVIDGSKEKVAYTMKPYATEVIPHIFRERTRKFLNLPDAEIPIGEALLRTLLIGMWTEKPNPLYTLVREFYGIQDGLDTAEQFADFHKVEANGKTYFIHKAKHVFANQVLAILQARQAIEALDGEKAQMIYVAVQIREAIPQLEKDPSKKAELDELKALLEQVMGMLSEDEKKLAALPSTIFTGENAAYLETVFETLLRANQAADAEIWNRLR